MHIMELLFATMDSLFIVFVGCICINRVFLWYFSSISKKRVKYLNLNFLSPILRGFLGLLY